MSTILLLAFTILTICLYKTLNLLQSRREFFKKIAQIPGPKGLPLIGNALDFKCPEDLLPNLSKYVQEFGPTFKLQLGPDSYVFTTDPKMIECITVSNTQITKSVTYKFLKNWLGNGLLATSNPRWKIHRRLISPTFHCNILKDFMPTFQKHADNLVRHWKQEIVQTGKMEKDIYDDVLACALDTICETAMGISINALNDGIRSKYMESVRLMGRIIMQRTFSFWKQFDVLYKLSPSYKQEVEMLRHIQSTTEKVIKQKRAEIAQKKKRNGSVGNILSKEDEFGSKNRIAFLDHLLAITTDNESGFTDKQLREEVDTFVFTGHDTTATASSYVLYLLAKNPDVQQKVLEEINLVLAGDTHVSYEKLSDLKYMEMVIKESLRIYPIASIFGRRLTEDVTYNGVFLPKDLNLAIFAPYGAHRNEKIFEDPERFDPERFTNENCAKRNPFSYIPFSAGPRNCVAKRFAMVEMKCFLVALVKNLKFSKSPDVDIKPCAEGILKSTNGIQLVIEARS